MLGKKKRFRLVLSLLLILTLVLPMGSVAAFATEIGPAPEIVAGPILDSNSYIDIELDDGLISLSDQKKFTVTLTIDPEFFYEKYGLDSSIDSLDYTELMNWMFDLKWEIVREKEGSPYYMLENGIYDRGELYPNVYTGDEISNWRTWSNSNQYFFYNISSTMFVPSDIMGAALLLPDGMEPEAAGELEALDEDVREVGTETEPPAAGADEDPDEAIDDEPEGIEELSTEEDAAKSESADEAEQDDGELIAGKDEERGAAEAETSEEIYEYIEPAYEIVVLENTAPAADVLDLDADPDQDLALEADEILIMPMAGPLDENIVIIYSFRNNYFYGTGNQSGYRNVQGSFIGDYTLVVSDEDGELASEDMYVNIYDSFKTYMETYEELEKIQEAAELNGRYMKIESYGTSEGGFDQYYVTFADSESSVDSYKLLKDRAEREPEVVKAEINGGLDYRIPFMINNIHPDENPGVDSQLNFLWKLATLDEIEYSEITEITAAGEVWEEKLAGSFDYITETIEDWATNMGRLGNNVQGAFVVEDVYTVEDRYLSVDEVLDTFIFIVSPNENPDGRVLNTRRNINQFDLNRDGAFQTQAETVNMMQLINEWNPTVMIELHGYVPLFLIEPCTPPHEPNLEYDLLIEHFYKGAEVFGNSAIGSLSDTYYNANGNNTFTKYVIPLRDYFGYAGSNDYIGNDEWYAWDDLSTNYTPSYAMLNAGTLGYTIETPYNNEGSTDLFEYGTYGMLQYFMDNKDEVFLNQLTFFERGLSNEDAKDTLDWYYMDLNDNRLEEDSWRTRYEETGNYFPEYYVIPVDAESQRNPSAAYEMEEYLLRNGVRVWELTEDTAFKGITYKEGSIVVSMRQAKRNYANAVLWDGVDASGFSGLYSESVTSFPYLRGFDCDDIVFASGEDPFEGKVAERTVARTEEGAAGSQLISEVEDAGYVVIMNNGLTAIQAVNAMLDDGVAVSLITGNNDYKGNYLISGEDWNDISQEYLLVGAEVAAEPSGSYEIEKPKVFIVSRFGEFANNMITSGYYEEWFADGYGYWDYYNNYSNSTSCFDVMAYAKQMGFTIVETPEEADVIVGSVAADRGAYGERTVEAILSGTPYIAHGYNSLEYVKSDILTTGFDFSGTRGAESLHYITYGNSVVTAARKNMGDNVVYNFGGAYITSVPSGANVLYSVANTNDFHIAGCYYDVYNTNYKGAVEAFEYVVGDLDVTVFANSIVNKAHQQDDYVYAATAIYSKMLGDDYDNSTGGDNGDGGGSGGGGRGGSGGGAGTDGTDGTGTDGGSGGADTGAAVENFTDVSKSDWFYEAVEYAVENGLFVGTSSTQFAPDQQMTRGMFVTVLGRLAEQSGLSTSGHTSSFTDVQVGAYYANYVSWAASNNIVSGYSATSFAPNDNITREQMAAILVRYAAYAGIELEEGEARTFSDVAGISSWAVDDVNKAALAGLLSGYEDGTFRPQNTATRAEVATVVKNLKENYID